MKVTNFLPYDDVGGVGFRTARAFNRFTDWDYKAYAGAPSYLQFPQHTPFDWNQIVDDWNHSDVVHVHDHLPRVGEPRPTIVTYHGTGFREQSEFLLAMSLKTGAQVLVSTLDLWILHPGETTWMPQMDDLDQLATYKQPHEGKIRVGHAPTNRALKSTAEFLEACDGLPVEVVLIEGKPWQESLQAKGTCDILFDQTAYGYGGNAIEAWAMNIPVICGAADNTLDEYRRRFGHVPFVEITPTTIRTAIEQLLDPTERTHWGQVGRKHAEKYHSYRAGVARLKPIYQALAAL